MKKLSILTLALAVLMTSSAAFAKTLIYEDYDEGFAGAIVGDSNGTATKVATAVVKDGVGEIALASGTGVTAQGAWVIAKSLSDYETDNFTLEFSVKAPNASYNWVSYDGGLELAFLQGYNPADTSSTTKPISVIFREHYNQGKINGNDITLSSGTVTSGWLPGYFNTKNAFTSYRLAVWSETDGEGAVTRKFNLYQKLWDNWRLVNAEPYTFTGNAVDGFFLSLKHGGSGRAIQYDYIKMYSGAGKYNDENCLHTFTDEPTVLFDDSFDDTDKYSFTDYGYNFGAGIKALTAANLTCSVLSLTDEGLAHYANADAYPNYIQRFSTPQSGERLVLEFDYIGRDKSGNIGGFYGQGTSFIRLFDASNNKMMQITAQTNGAVVDNLTGTTHLSGGVSAWSGMNGPVGFKVVVDGDDNSYTLWSNMRNMGWTSISTGTLSAAPVRFESCMRPTNGYIAIDNFKAYTIKKTETVTVPDFVDYATGREATAAAANADIITATAVNGAVSGTLITAFYDADDRFVDCVQGAVDAEAGFPQLVTSKASLPSDASADWNVKAFLWDGIDTMVPLTTECGSIK